MTEGPTLVERASSALDRLKRLNETALLANEGDRVRTRADELEAPVAEMEHILLVEQALRRRGVSPELPQSAIATARTQLAALRDRYRSDPTQITAPDGRLRFTLWDPLRALPNEIRSSLNGAWEAHARSLLREQSVEILEVLERVPGLQVDARAIRAMASEFDSLSSRLPRQEEDVDRIEELAREIERRWQSLEGAGIPSDVLDFLAAASVSGAPLALLTPAVREWLQERSLTQFVRLTLSGER
jgi:hypothetical protein